MNKFDERYEIRQACMNDVENIMRFIGTYWKEGHVLSQSRQLFEYEYVKGDEVCFILAVDKKTGEIEAIFGYLRCSDTEEFDKRHIWGSIWMVNKTHPNEPLLGIEVARRACAITKSKMHIGNGANAKTTVPLRKIFFREKCVRMKQYYYLNPDITDFKIAKINYLPERQQEYLEKECTIELVEFHNIDEIDQQFSITDESFIPYKDSWYVNKRYFHHIKYDYKIYGLQRKNGRVEALLIGREVKCNQAKIFRIIDYIGNHSALAEIGEWIEKMVRQNGYEYMDFYEYGIPDEYMLQAGMVRRKEGDENIIPNYFEPFLQENIEIWCHYKEEGTTFFKGDGDQDRPNCM